MARESRSCEVTTDGSCCTLGPIGTQKGTHSPEGRMPKVKSIALFKYIKYPIEKLLIMVGIMSPRTLLPPCSLTCVLHLQTILVFFIIQTYPLRPRIMSAPFMRVVVLEHGNRMLLKLRIRYNTQKLRHNNDLNNQTLRNKALGSANPIYGLGGRWRC